MQSALKAAALQVKQSKARIREGYDMTYEYKSGGGKSAVDAALEKYKP